MNKDRTVKTILAINFTESLGYGIIIPIIPFVAKNLGISELYIGFIFATYAFSQLIGAPILGYLSDILGRKKVLLLSQVGTILGYLLLVTGTSFWMLLFSRFVDGILGGNVTMTHSIIVDFYDNKEQEKLFNLMSVTTGAGILLGPLIAGILSYLGLSTLIILSASLSIITIVLNLIYLPESLKKVNTAEKQIDLYKILEPLKNINLRKVFYVKIIQEIVVNCFIVTTPIFVFRLLGYSVTQSSYLLSVYFFFALVFQILQHYLSKFLPSKNRLLILSFCLYIIAFCINILLLNLVAVILTGLIFMIGLTLLNPLLNILISRECDENNKGLTFGLNQFVSSFGQIIGPILGYISIFYFSEIGFLIACLTLSISGLFYSIKLKSYA